MKRMRCSLLYGNMACGYTEGYYLVRCNGIFTGVLSVTMRQIEDKEILLSDKYDTQ